MLPPYMRAEACVKSALCTTIRSPDIDDCHSGSTTQDHVVDILGFIADDLESAQTPRERFDKSRGVGPPENPFSESAAEVHAALRLADGFDIARWFPTGRFAQAL